MNLGAEMVNIGLTNENIHPRVINPKVPFISEITETWQKPIREGDVLHYLTTLRFAAKMQTRKHRHLEIAFETC